MKVLGLHGFRTNGSVLDKQSEMLRKTLQAYYKSQYDAASPLIKYYFPDAPHAATGPTEDVVLKHFGDGPYNEWWRFVQREGQNDVDVQLVGQHETLEYLEHYIDEHGPFDVVLGFSQGAAVAVFLANHFRKRQGRIPWRINVLVAGSAAKSHQHLYRDIASEALAMPTIIINGEADYLWDYFADFNDFFDPAQRWIFVHPSGHKFPSTRVFQESYIAIAAIIHRQLTTTTDVAGVSKL